MNGLTIKETHALYKKGKSSPSQVTDELLDQLEAKQNSLNTFITVTRAQAMAAAQAVENDMADGDFDVLAGVPMAVKDVIVTRDIQTTAASRILKGYVPPYDATAVARVKQRGAVIMGKLNCDAFAHGASGENSDFGPVKNPHDQTRVAGGSSSGPAAAVAAGEVTYALATDTGGSIRQPASFCGVVGLKPTYGRVSRSGLISMTSSTDTIGPITKTIEDAAIVLQAMAGQDTHDATSSGEPVVDFGATLAEPMPGKKIGIPKEYFGEGLDEGVRKQVDLVIDLLKSMGVEMVEISLPHTKYAVPVYYIVTPSEVSANLARFDGIRYGFSKTMDADVKDLYQVYAKTRGQGLNAENKRRVMIGTYALSSGYYDAYYKKASQVRRLIGEDFTKVFDSGVDALLTPVSPHPAFKIGSQVNDPLKMYLEDVYLTGPSLAGLPAVSVPAGTTTVDGHKLPVGVQIIGGHFNEAGILNIARHIEMAELS